jgi:RNA polymerase sigma-70 factor (ECF subfamily)
VCRAGGSGPGEAGGHDSRGGHRTIRRRRASGREEGESLDTVTRARDGDADAFDELVERHTGWVYRLAAAIVGPDEAVDVSQDVFGRAWRELPQLRDADRFEAWLRRIVVNRCRDAGRRAASRVREIPLDQRTASASPDPRTVIERDTDLAAAIARLSFDHRTILALHYGADLTHQSVADVLRIPPGTVKSRLGAALERLRVDLDEGRP